MDEFKEAMSEVVSPIRDEMQQLRSEIEDLRSDVKGTLQNQAVEVNVLKQAVVDLNG